MTTVLASIDWIRNTILRKVLSLVHCLSSVTLLEIIANADIDPAFVRKIIY